MAYKAALFDLDDTLLESVKQKWLQHQTIAMRHYGVEITTETMRRVWGMPLTEMIRASYQNAAEPEIIHKILVDSNQEFPKGVLDGAVAAIDRLLDAGVHVGVVTSAPTGAAEYDLRRHGFDVDRMLCVIGEDRCHAHKPDPAVFDGPLQMLKELGIGASAVVYVGDLAIDMMAANAAGFDFIAVTTGIVSAEEFESLGALTVTSGITKAADHILAGRLTA